MLVIHERDARVTFQTDPLPARLIGDAVNNARMPHYSNPDWPTDPTHRNHFNSYSFTCFMPDRTPFPFYTKVGLRPVATYVSLANSGVSWTGIHYES